MIQFGGIGPLIGGANDSKVAVAKGANTLSQVAKFSSGGRDRTLRRTRGFTPVTCFDLRETKASDKTLSKGFIPVTSFAKPPESLSSMSRRSTPAVVADVNRDRVGEFRRAYSSNTAFSVWANHPETGYKGMRLFDEKELLQGERMVGYMRDNYGALKGFVVPNYFVLQRHLPDNGQGDESNAKIVQVEIPLSALDFVSSALFNIRAVAKNDAQNYIPTINFEAYFSADGKDDSAEKVSVKRFPVTRNAGNSMVFICNESRGAYCHSAQNSDAKHMSSEAQTIYADAFTWGESPLQWIEQLRFEGRFHSKD